MDWSRVASELEGLATLSEGDVETHLTQLTQTDPQIATELRRFIARKDLSRSFLQTSANSNTVRERSALKDGDRIGVWTIEKLVGAGGMGEVYKAARSDGSYEQTVALKLVQLGDELDKSRFERERRRLASLDHPNVSRIIDGGEAPDGRPFMAMEYVEGQAIDEHSRAQRLSQSSILDLFLDLCAAVNHAHSRLILHRDIKPENILVDRDGSLRLIDFGISSFLDGEQENSAGPLTVAYAAPEQLNGDSLSVATDVFAMGVSLYQLVAGELPHRNSKGGVELDAKLIKSPELYAVLTKATRFNAGDRYGSVNTLMDDIKAIQEKSPVQAYSTSPLYRFSKTIRRFPLASGLAAAFIASLVLGLGATLHQTSQAQIARIAAEEELERANFFLDLSESSLSTANTLSDSFSVVFAGEVDSERIKGLLLDYVMDEQDDWESNPRHPAHVSYAIGRYFAFRHDYTSALKVLEPWVLAGYGPDTVLSRGKNVLAIAYMGVGRSDEALPLMRDVETGFLGTPLEGTQEHVAIAARIAHGSETPADNERAEKLLVEALEKNEATAYVKLFFLNELAVIQRRLGKMSAAYSTAHSLLDHLNATPAIDINGRTTVRLNVASWELFHAKDLSAAQALVDLAIEEGNKHDGENRRTGALLELKALIKVANKELETAQVDIKTALEIIERYAGRQDTSFVQAFTTQIRIQMLKGDWAQAATSLSQMSADAKDLDEKPLKFAHNAMALLQIEMATQNTSATEPDFDRDYIERDLYLSAYLQNLIERGLASTN